MFILKKIKSFFIKLFKREQKEKILNLNECGENKTEKLLNLKVNSEIEKKYKILNLQQKLKNNKIAISDLTNEELDEIILLYKKQIKNKKDKLMQYRRIIFENN